MKLDTVKLTNLDDLKAMRVHDYQRKVVTSKVKQYMDSMQEHGFWKSHPIVWFRHEGSKMIIWGHHRRAAAVALKIPAFTQEATDITLEQSADLIATENWSTWKIAETVARECRRGNQDYLTLKHYIDQGFTTIAASSLLRGSSASSGNFLEAVKAGTFKVTTTRQADIILGLIRAAKGANPEVKNTYFIAALSRCLWVPEFNVARFEHKLCSNPGMLKKRSNITDFTCLIEEIYNFQSKDKKPIQFMADQEMLKRGAKKPSAASENAA